MKIRKLSAKWMFRIGGWLAILTILGIPFLFLVIGKTLDLYEINIPFLIGNHFFLPLLLIAIITITSWSYLSIKWADFALNNLDHFQQEIWFELLKDKENNFKIKPWNQLNGKRKIGLSVFIIILFILATLGDNYRLQEKNRLSEYGQFSEAKILSIHQKVRNKKKSIVVKFSFQFADNLIVDSISISSGWFNKVEEKNGFEILVNDKFMVNYLPEEPDINQIQFHLPQFETLHRYKDLTINSLNSEEFSKSESECLVNSVYQAFGLNGIAIIYNRKKSYWENDNFNRIKYQLLLKKPGFRAAVSNCLSNNSRSKIFD